MHGTCRRHLTTQSNAPVVHKIQIYEQRPSSCEALTFKAYFKKYELWKTEPKRACDTSNCIGRDSQSRRHWVVEHTKLVRFTLHHPVQQMQGFFYNILLDKISFRDENQLFSTSNTERCYFKECILRGYIQNVDDLQAAIEENAKYQLKSEVDAASAVAILCSMTVQNDEGRFIQQQVPSQFQNVPVTEKIAAVHQQLTDNHIPHLPRWHMMGVPDATQLKVINLLQHPQAHGVHIVTGGPGTGKSYIMQYFASWLAHHDTPVILSATTGAAAYRLAATANTVHSAFSIPAHGRYLRPLAEDDLLYHELNSARAVIIDEMSMLTQQTLGIVYKRMQQACGQDCLARKLLILVGDFYQLPPVCFCKHPDNRICCNCHVITSSVLDNCQVHHLKASHRHASDPDFMKFLTRIRKRQPSQMQLDLLFNDCLVKESDDLDTILSQDITVICTHLKEVDQYNARMLRLRYSATEIEDIAADTNLYSPEVEALPEQYKQSARQWASRIRNSDGLELAVGCSVINTTNADKPNGVVNGAAATVVEVKRRNGIANAIIIKLNSSGLQQTVYRTKRHSYYFGNVLVYCRLGFLVIFLNSQPWNRHSVLNLAQSACCNRHAVTHLKQAVNNA